MGKFQRMDGVVTAVFENRGFAFAISEVDGLAYFLHFRDFKNTDEFKQLHAGDTVSFTAIRTPGQARPRGLVVRTIEKLLDAA